MPPIRHQTQTREKDLIRAIVNEDEGKIKKLVKSTAPHLKDLSYIGTEERAKQTPLVFACYSKKLKSIKVLLESGVDPNIPDQIGIPPIIILTLILSKDTSIEIKKEFDSLFQLFLEKNARTEYKNDSGQNMLMYFIEYNYTAASITLIKNNPLLINDCDKKNNSPLNFAIEHQQLPVIIQLVEHGANLTHINEQGNNILHILPNTMASHQIAVIIFKYIQSKMALNYEFINKKNNEGDTPLAFALFSGNLELIKLLIAAGADGLITNYGEMLPIHCAISGIINPGVSDETIDLFIKIFDLLHALPFPKEICKHPVLSLFFLQETEISPPNFDRLLDKLIEIGYHDEINVKNKKTITSLTISKAWMFDAAKKKFPSLQCQEVNGKLIISRSKQNYETLFIKNEWGYEINRLQTHLTKIESTVCKKEALALFIDLLKSIEYKYIEKIYYNQGFISICNMLFEFTLNNELEKNEAFFNYANEFLTKLLVIEGIVYDRSFSNTSMAFYLKRFDFFIQTQINYSVHSMFSMLSYINSSAELLQYYAYCMSLLLSRSPERYLLDLLKVFSKSILSRYNKSYEVNELYYSRLLEFLTVHLKTINALFNSYHKEKLPIPVEEVEEYQQCIDLFTHGLTRLGDQYKKYYSYQKFIIQFRKDLEGKLPKEKVLPDVLLSTKRINRPIKTRTFVEREISEKTSYSPEEIEKRIALQAAEEKDRNEERKREQALRRELKSSFETEDHQKTHDTSNINAFDSKAPTINPEENVKSLYKHILAANKNSDVIKLEYPQNTKNSFWGCFAASPQQFDECKDKLFDDEFKTFLNKFNEGKITFDQNGTGIVCFGDLYYLRIDKHLIRVHAHKYQLYKDAPILLVFNTVTTHDFHEAILNDPHAKQVFNHDPVAPPIRSQPIIATID